MTLRDMIRNRMLHVRIEPGEERRKERRQENERKKRNGKDRKNACYHN